MLCLPLILLTAYWLDVALSRTQPTSAGLFGLAVAIACPAAVAGSLCAQPGVPERMPYFLEPLMLLFTAAVLLSAIHTMAGSVETRGIGGATYQTASYVGATAFNINIFFILFGRDRPKYARGRPYRALAIILIPAQIIAVLLTGGRGGFVLLIAGTAIQTLIARQLKVRKIARNVMLVIFTLAPLLIWFVPNLLANDATAPVIRRVFAYFGSDGIDWAGTSGRDIVYSDALAELAHQPFFGHGVFSWGMDRYPHNFWLEVLLNGGIIYAFAWLLALVWLIWRAASIVRQDHSSLCILPVAMYPLVMLQFSGTYWATGVFWFVLAFILCLDRPAAHPVLASSSSLH